MYLKSASALILSCVLAHATMQAASLQKESLESEFQQLAKGFDGRVGICVEDESGAACLNPDQRFSLQSVMKLIVSLAVMDAVDHRGWHVDEAVVVHKEDLSLYVQPISKLVTAEGYRTTIGDLVRRAIVDSDSAAVDILVKKLGGPARVQDFLDRHKLAGVRFDRDEKHLQTEIIGLTWRPEFVDPPTLDRAIDHMPETRRDEAYRRYQADPRDTATPAGMAALLFSLAKGKLLSPNSTKYILDVMAQTVTFPTRLKAGVPKDWSLGHKTGTSGTWKGVTAATNDIGIMTAPDGHQFAIVVFIGDSRESSVSRDALMSHAASLTAAHYH